MVFPCLISGFGACGKSGWYFTSELLSQQKVQHFFRAVFADTGALVDGFQQHSAVFYAGHIHLAVSNEIASVGGVHLGFGIVVLFQVLVYHSPALVEVVAG